MPWKTEKTDEILNCPFCDSGAILDTFESRFELDKEVHAVSCNNEECPMGHIDFGYFDRKTDAIKAWNTRKGETK